MKLKILLLVIVTFFITHSHSQEDSVYYFEGFENGDIPEGWNQEFENGAVNWRFEEGGYSTTPEMQNTRRPPNAHTGDYNALYQYQSLSGEATKLVTKRIPNFDLAIKPELRFWHAQYEWYHISAYYNDELRVYYKNGLDSSWNLLATYTEPVEEWTERSILLPDSTLSEDYYIAFEGKTNWGFGVCIDDVSIVETGELTRSVDTITVRQVSTDYLSTGSENNPILRVDIRVKGNTDDLPLNELVVSSLNMNDNDIAANGVKLFVTEEKIFNTSNQVGNGISFSDGKATFSNLDYNLPTGTSYLWITYDIDENGTHGNTVDAQILQENIEINGEYYYSTDLSPTGTRTIFETIFADNFKTDKGWTLTGEFQRGAPQGLGGDQGNPDPDYAYSDTSVLGTDLYGLGAFEGDYEMDLELNEYQATTPYLNLYYYKDVVIRYYRWLNIDNNDHCSIEVSSDKGNTWNSVWNNEGLLFENEWNLQEINISDYADRKDSVMIRFNLGGSNDYWQFSGWNIDDFTLTGDYILNDVGVTGWLAPYSGCGHTSEEEVRVKVKNYGPVTSKDTIPVGFSFDGGTHMYVDTLFEAIEPGEETIFTFETKFDLTHPGMYDNIVATTMLEADEDNRNDQFDTSIYIVPTYTLPYTENFETNNGYWRSGGKRKLWEHGEPINDHIVSAASGDYAWVTDLDAYYIGNDSAYIESPCFNFSGSKNPVLECNLIYETKREKDGLAFYYSIDDGFSWHHIDTLNHRWNWKWYNNDSLFVLNNEAGFDSISDGWVRVRQFLPPEINNQSSVKFRLLFESDTATYFFEGAGMDDFSLFEAPPDVGVVDFLGPDSACELSDSEHIKIAIKNFAMDTLFSGDSIPLGCIIHEKDTINETFYLEKHLLPDDTLHYTFNTPVDMWNAGRYNITVYTLKNGDADFYVDSLNNDTLVTYTSVYGMPDYDLGPVIGSEQVDTVILDAGDGFESYQWQDVDSTSRFYHVALPGDYEVTVTNVHGCTATDSTKVLYSTEDFGVVELVSPVSDCELTSNEQVSIKVKNYSGNIYEPDDTIVVAYTVNTNDPVNDTIFLTEELGIGDTVAFTFAQTIDMDMTGIYDLHVYSILEGDIDLNNDTIHSMVEAYGYPDVELGPDTIFTSRADTILFEPGEGFGSYLWQDSSTLSSFQVTSKASALYRVKVTDIHSCGSDADSVQVIASDVAINTIISPVSACELTDQEIITVKLKNESADTLQKGTIIPVGYRFNEQVPVYENIELENNLNPKQSLTYAFGEPVNISITGDYELEVFSMFHNDVIPGNDTLNTVISAYGFPEIDLGYDSIFTAEADSIILIADEGYASYEWYMTKPTYLDTISHNDSLMVSSPATHKYIVKVTNIHGCVSYDSVMVYTKDIGILDISAPSNDCKLSAFENVTVILKNFGRDTFNIDDKIAVAYQLDENELQTDTVMLEQNIYPYGIYTYTFTSKADLSEIKTYDIRAFTSLNPDINVDNDEYEKVVEAYGFPDIELGKDTIVRAENYLLDAGEGFEEYLWNDGSENTTYLADTTGEYSVKITDDHGCSSSDTIRLQLLFPDLAVSGLLKPLGGCYRKTNAPVEIEIENAGTDTLYSGENVTLSYQYNDGPDIQEVITVNENIYPGGKFKHTFEDMVDIGSVDHDFEISLNKEGDLDNSNDTLETSRGIYPYPEVTLGNDTILRTMSYQLHVDYNENYTYEWNDSSVDTSLTTNKSGVYWVKVTDSRANCVSGDTIILTFFITDIELTSVSAPSPVCEKNNLEFEISIHNQGNVNLISSDEIFLGYQFAEDTIQKQVNLDATLPPGQDYTFNLANVYFDNAGEQEVNFFIKLTGDLDPDNDSLSSMIPVLPSPFSDLGGSSDTLKTGLPYQLEAKSGYSDYEWQDGSPGRSFQASSQDWYWVEITGNNGCSFTDSVFVFDLTSIQDIDGNTLEIIVYPNPVRETLNILSENIVGDHYIFELINPNGQILIEKNIKKNTRIDLDLDVRSFPSGIYYYRIFNRKDMFSEKIMIQ